MSFASLALLLGQVITSEQVAHSIALNQCVSDTVYKEATRQKALPKPATAEEIAGMAMDNCAQLIDPAIREMETQFDASLSMDDKRDAFTGMSLLRAKALAELLLARPARARR